MNEKTKQCNCTEAGYCETFGVYMGEALYKKCQASQQWRDIFCNNYNNNMEVSEETQKLRKTQSDNYNDCQELKEEQSKMSDHQEQLDSVVEELEKQGINLENYEEKSNGLGDVIGNVFTKLGITEETVEKWSGIGGCGCQKRKKFLNKIIPFRKKA